ncbi:MAG: hypothetical protein O3A87_01745 [Verrucomicrobia bacterium]|nr:hypothetical protein [Verrucomicrobiota bacterium]MDA1005194.1 hypothetical protein [Verrucomicrobiota bacterium]
MKRSLIVALPAAILLALGNLWAVEPDRPVASAERPAGAIFHPDPSHLWNRLHHAFFVRPEGGPESPDPDAVDPPLWPDTSGFLKTGASNEAAIAVLDEFLSSDGAALIPDPLKRAVMQHDLWAAFDWSVNTSSPESPERSSDRSLAPLRSLLAAAIRQLALTGEEIDALPDNLANAAAAGVFRADYDPANPRTPFLPADLLDPAGPWVCVRGALEGPSAPIHADYYQGRSPFLVFLRLPGDRKATMGYLNELNQATSRAAGGEAKELPQFPVGTMAALLRRMTVIDDRGRIQLTPVTQTLQMRVYRLVGSEVTDHENSQAAVKFRMERAGLFAEGHQGLKAIDWSEPLSVSLLQQNDRYEDKDGHSSIKTTMQSCIACHSCGGATIHSVFTYKQDDWVPGANLMAPNQLRLLVTDPLSEVKRTVRWKQGRYDWGMLMGLLERP